MLVEELIAKVKQQPKNISFAEVMQTISDNYHYRPTNFTNGSLFNEAGTNEGSCKIFYFAKLNALSPVQTLACFGHYYREDVLGNPHGNDHGNIRQFMNTGWAAINFEFVALSMALS